MVRIAISSISAYGVGLAFAPAIRWHCPAEDRHMPTRTPIRPRPVGRRPLAWLAALVVLALLANASIAVGALAAPPPATPDSARPADLVASDRAVDPFGGAPAPEDAPPAPTADPADTAPGVEPSIQYEEALAHAKDPNRFTPGGRVTVGYTPRADDGWPVGGRSPVDLPAGYASGRDMARAAQGSRWATKPPAGVDEANVSAPVDGAAPTGVVVAAEPAIAGPTTEATPAAGTAVAGLRRQVFGFLPYWTLADSTTVLKYDYLSTIAYFSVGADVKGNLLKRNADGSLTTGWGGWTSSRMTSVITAAHQHHTRVVLTISVFAWTSSQATKQAALLGSSTARLNLARQAAAAVRDRGADGINLDFEPIVSGYADEYTAFVRTVRSELNRIRSGYQLTFDTTGFIGNYPIESATAAGAADAIFIMGYDYRTAGSATAGSIDPLNGAGYTLIDTIRSYTARVSPSRLILGLPYYGRAWSTTSSALRATNQSGTKYGASTSVIYDTAADLVQVYGRRYDTIEQSAWFAYQRQNCTTTYGCVTSWRQVYFDDAQALKARYDLVIRSGLRGSGIWALGYDGTRPELYGAISLKYLHDTTAPESGIVVMPARRTDSGFVVSWRTVDDSAIAGHDVQVSTDGGAWATWLTGTRATSDVYLGTNGHGYAFRVRATDSYGNVGAWDVSSTYDATPALAVGGFGRVVADGLAQRVAADTASLRVASMAVGDRVSIIGGPVSADGYTWYEVTGPLTEWNTVAFTRSGVWVAARSSTETYLTAAVAPNASVVDAGVDALTFGDGGEASLGSTAAALSARAFSPNGDTSKDRLRLRWTNNVTLASMTLRAFRLDGTFVGTRALPDVTLGPQAYDWDGALTGVGVPADGRYVLQLLGTNSAGASYSAPSSRPVTATQIARYAVTIDRLPPTVTSASSSGVYLSPNGDGRNDSLTVTLAAAGGASWGFTAARVSGSTVAAPVRSLSGPGTSARVTWTGRTDADAAAADGTYRLTLRITDLAGNQSVRSWTVLLDRLAPTLTATVAPGVFSPNGDFWMDSTMYRWSSTERVAGSIVIRRGSTPIRRWLVSGATAGAVRWTGLDSSGHQVPEGTYTIWLDVLDAAGNRRIVSRPIVVDRTAGFLRWSATSFYPQDGDALRPSSRVSFHLIRAATTSLVIVDAAGHVVRTAWVNRSLASGSWGWTWNGKLASGAWAPVGHYSAVLTVASRFATTTLRRSVFAGPFTVTPSATTLRVGQTLTLTIRTVEPLASRPVVTFDQAGLAPVARTATLISTGLYRVSFTVGAGGSGMAAIGIRARDTAGGTNRTSLTVLVL
jgi:spore germination protein YaaH/flagellar hook assembly protein FlgD